jgi:hypothetical protein
MINLTFSNLQEKCVRRFYYQHINPPADVVLKKDKLFIVNPIIDYVLGSTEFEDRVSTDIVVDIFPSDQNSNAQKYTSSKKSRHYLNIDAMIEKTIKAIQSHPSVLIKNGYLHDHTTHEKFRKACTFDALEIKNGKAKLHLIFSKSAKSPHFSMLKDELKEITFIYHVIKNALSHYKIELNQVDLYSIHQDYRRHGEVRFDQMIKIENVSNELSKTTVPAIPNDLLDVIHHPKEPSKILSKTECSECDFQKKNCWTDGLPNISKFYRMLGKTQNELYLQNYKAMADVPDQLLNDCQKIQKQVSISNQPYQDLAHIQQFINQLEYPLAFLDFETLNTTFPIFEGFTVNQSFPFQYALDVIESNEPDIDYSKIKHYEYLGDGTNDPTKDLLNQLLSQIPSQGSIIVYHATAERSFLKSLIAIHGFETEINDLISRLVDLKNIFEVSNQGAQFYYYDHKFEGSFSLKKVVDVLLPVKYDHLAIKDGLQASNKYENLASQSPEDALKTRTDLLNYCNFDARVMINLLDFFKKLS